MNVIKRAWGWTLDLLFPPMCSGCGRSGVVLCGVCRDAIFVVLEEFACEDFRVFVACGRSEILRKVIHQFKYKYSEVLAAELAELLAKRLDGIDMRGVWLVPVPLYWKRERERGFNQSEMLAKMVGVKLGVACIPLLRRVRETRVQATLKRAERVQNVRGVFAVNARCVETCAGGRMPETVFVLDDVITSGSTFLECARVLKTAGVKRVCGIMLSHGL